MQKPLSSSPRWQPVITHRRKGGVAINTAKERLMGYWSTPARSKEIHVAAEADPRTETGPALASDLMELSLSSRAERDQSVCRTAADVSMLRLNIKIVERGCQTGFDVIWFERVK